MDFFRFSALFITCVLFFSHFTTVTADEAEEDETPFNYDRENDKGPDNWGKLNPKWTACGNGTFQSPVDLSDNRVVALPTLELLKRRYKPAPAIINRGHAVSVLWEGDAGGVVINGTMYKLQRCHWHTPSEHTVDGKRFNMEIHLVHNSARGHIAVVGILYKLGRHDPFLAKLIHSIKRGDDKGKNTGVKNAGVVDPWNIKFGNRKYYRYIGSLTVPPCTEGVLWTVLKKVRTVSREQIRALREAVHVGFENNARPIQHSKDIAVYMYHPRTRTP